MDAVSTSIFAIYMPIVMILLVVYNGAFTSGKNHFSLITKSLYFFEKEENK